MKIDDLLIAVTIAAASIAGMAASKAIAQAALDAVKNQQPTEVAE